MMDNCQMDTLLAHAKEIQTEVRNAPQGWRVLAEVTNSGEWAGCGRVTRGVQSSLAHENKGIGVFFNANRFASIDDIRDIIWSMVGDGV